MTRTLVIAVAIAGLLVIAGCGSTRAYVSPAPAPIRISADMPPSPTTWPAYPRFSQHSCWGRPSGRGVIAKTTGVAPSYAPARTRNSPPTPPREIVEHFLARFGDRRYIRSITLGPASATIGTHIRALMQYGGHHPPADALHAYIHAPLANYKNQARHPAAAQALEYGIAEYEASLVGGALRDDFCSAGGAPLISWSGESHGYANGLALEQRFPNPTPAAFRHRVALVGRRLGFYVASLRLLRPEQFAPLLIVRTSRPRKEFVRDAGKIMTLLDPTSFAPHLRRVAETFEGFFFAAEDARGPFIFFAQGSRGESEGHSWVANLCLVPPAARMGPTSPKQCT